ncbi:hypothetical protein L798_09186 [Zootermopsis nevadensis]|uniref:Uncharacterized protein n=1 Tax=Zootermopsis nevadensis TaxID=136037 RepID=A0A067QES6_ZOONE|nr:hypothetical protein L798_09186 [Zootermopsis nevadensis]
MVKAKNNHSTENMKSLIKLKVNPTENKVGVSSFKALKNGNMLIESSNKRYVEVICNSINEKSGNELEANGAKLRNPRMILYNVPEVIHIDSMKQSITEQNP